MLAGFCVAVYCNGSSRSAGKIEEGGEHGLQHGLRFLPQLLGLEALHHVQEGLKPSLANTWMGGFCLSYHVKDGTEAESNDSWQIGPGVVRGVLHFELSALTSFLPGSSSGHLDAKI